jgi:hypothetical protein
VVLGGGYSARAWEAQYRSVRRTLEKYGGAGGGKGAPRPATWLEKWYTR